MAGTISSRTTAFSTASVWTKPMIKCRYQELDLAEGHAVAPAVCHCAAASAHCRQTGLRRLGTDGSQTPRRRKPDSNRGSSCEGGCCFRPEKEGRITKRGRSRKRHLLRGPTSDPPSSGKYGLAASRARMLSSRSVSAQAWVIGYFAKISSARLKALSIAASGAVPFFITSNSAMLNTCSASTCAIAGL
jgi:hypothetical protein